MFLIRYNLLLLHGLSAVPIMTATITAAAVGAAKTTMEVLLSIRAYLKKKDD